MTIAQLRAFIMLGNVAATCGLLAAGGSFLWRGLMGSGRTLSKIEIPKPDVKVERGVRKEPRENFKNIWKMPVVPSQQAPEGGEAEAVKPDIKISLEQAMKRLRDSMRLLLTHANEDRPWDGWATVELRGGAGTGQMLIRPGEDVASFRVLEINYGDVVFQVEGIPAPLPITAGVDALKKAMDPSSSGSRSGPGAEGFGAAAVHRPSGEEPFVAQGKRVSPVMWHVSQQEATYLAKNYHRLLREVKFAGRLDADGKIVGVELTEVDDNSLVAKRGFVARDIIKSVNGDPVGDPRNLPGVIAKHRGAKQLVIVFIRKGVEKTVTYVVK